MDLQYLQGRTFPGSAIKSSYDSGYLKCLGDIFVFGLFLDSLIIGHLKLLKQEIVQMRIKSVSSSFLLIYFAGFSRPQFCAAYLVFS